MCTKRLCNRRSQNQSRELRSKSAFTVNEALAIIPILLTRHHRLT